jgi:group I intron endonuclease
VHKSGIETNHVITDAFKKYGINNFEFSIIEECLLENLIEREQYFLDTLQPFADTYSGYNLRKTATSNIGLKHTAETKAKMTISHTGSRRSEEVKEKMSRLQKERGGYGPKIQSEEHVRKELCL